MPVPTRLTLPDPDGTDQLADLLGARYVVRLTPPRRATVRGYDTFDWRLHRAGWSLEHTLEGRSGALVLRQADRSLLARVDEADAPGAPVLAGDLPDGPLREHLAPVIEMRALLEMGGIRTERRMLELEDREGKTRVRVVVERPRVLRRGRAGPALDAVVEVHALRGYEADAERVRGLLAGEGGLEPSSADPLTAAFLAEGHEPGSYSSKLRVELSPELTAAEAYLRVLRHLLVTMDLNEAGTRADLDSEFLHDYRVAVRRTRSVLGHAVGVLPDESLRWLRPGFKWFGDITSPVRDLDVYLLSIPELEAGLPDPLRGHLAPLARYLAERQRREQRALVRALDSRRAERLLVDYRAFLAAPPAVEPPDAERPVTEVARERIWKAYRRLVRHGREITAESPGPALHELRKDAKKLRYLLECFAPLFPADELKALVRELKAVQEVLGTFQDCEVQIDSLNGFAAGMLDRPDPALDRHDLAAAVMAMGTLVEQLDERRDRAREGFAACFGRFDAADNRERVRRLFHPRASQATDG